MMPESREGTEHRARTKARLPRAAFTACTLPLVLLFVQFLLGIYLNLFVAHPEGAALTSTHIAVGIAILLANLFALVTFARTRPRRPGLCALATLGSLSTVLACAAGFRFLATGQNGWSYTMAIGFLLTATADVLIPLRAPGRTAS
jgi:hypothetical protein